VNANYPIVNVNAQSGQDDSLLNTIRNLLKLRGQEKSLHAGDLEWIENLPAGILGYTRILGNERIHILMNFTNSQKEFQFSNDKSVFKLNQQDDVKNGSCHLSAWGGMVLRSATT
jgi:oligo-1,6-glucosidase